VRFDRKTDDGGPSAAIETFLERRGTEWEIDFSYCDFFGINVTWNVNGFLRKKALALL
jgi:cephalosporin hydroxylase